MLMIQPYRHQQPQSLKPLTKSWSLLEWVASNKLVLNSSKTKSIVFGTNYSISSRPQLDLVMHCVAVEETKLSWSKHIDSMVVQMGRGMSIIKRCSASRTPHSKKHILRALVLSYLVLSLIVQPHGQVLHGTPISYCSNEQ